MQSILSKIPLNRILFETDDTETDIYQVYRDYSQATSTPLEEVKAQIEQNFLAIFGA
jgi:Tat protein secretion system quality control protein TatD with DNase activity